MPLAPDRGMPTAVFDRIAKQAVFHDAGHGYDEFGLHPSYLAHVVEAGRSIYERYFRVDSNGAHHIPATGPTILIANHGGILPVDAAMLCMDVLLRTDPPRIPRAIGDHFISRLPIVSTMFSRLGVVSGARENACCLLQRGELLAIWPEGVTGPAKAFRDRYTIQTWRVGFAELAIRHRAAVVPVAVVGSEESWPLLGKLARVHPFGAPYLPIPASPLPLPAHYHVRYGAPIRLAYEPEDAANPEIVAAAAAKVRVELELLLAESLASRKGVFR